ncbi:MAG: TRAP transporter small permease subunit [Propionibacteriales bacterium]|nr:TRAP transporter small permease subunit [Propionibacteriales bacterium]
MSTADLGGPTAPAVGPPTGRWSSAVAAADRALARIDKLALAACAALFVALVGVVLLSVVFRYVLNSSLLWGEELARYLAVWLVFLGLSSAHRRRQHVSVGSVLRLFPFVNNTGSRRAAEGITVLLCAVITWISAESTFFNFQLNQTSPALQIPIAWAYLAIPVGFLLMTLQSAVSLVQSQPSHTEEP